VKLQEFDLLLGRKGTAYSGFVGERTSRNCKIPGTLLSAFSDYWIARAGYEARIFDVALEKFSSVIGFAAKFFYDCGLCNGLP